jgi:hypothetical protein
MPALRILGLVILAAFVVSIFVVGYQYLQAQDRERRARDAALELNEGVQAVIATGNQQIVEITIPIGYTLRFENYRVKIDGFAVPADGYSMLVTGPKLEEGTHHLTIVLENNSVVVSE